MRTKVKICGITNRIDAMRAVKLRADYLGFNFYVDSPRYIAPAEARRIVQRLPRGAQAVGVFVDAEPGQISETAKKVGLKVVQLHGSESPRAVGQLAKKHVVWKAIRVRRSMRPALLRKYGEAQALLLDSFHAGAMGGTGKAFDWKLALRAKKSGRIILAGGLTSKNVAAAIRAVEPWAVDVASGVESRPGKKDARKLRAFFRAVRGAKVK